MQAEICDSMLPHIFIKNIAALKMSASIKENLKTCYEKLCIIWNGKCLH
jgi:hypothetical protein